MNRRDLLKYTLAIPVVGCVQQSDVFTLREQPEKVNRAPRDTDGPEYDEWLDDYGKDEMHL